MPMRDFVCGTCKHKYETLVRRDPVLLREEVPECPKCQAPDVAIAQISAHGGYTMSSGGGSTRPRSAGSFKRGK